MSQTEQSQQLLDTTVNTYANAVTEVQLIQGTAAVPFAATITPTVQYAQTTLVVAALTANLTVAAPVGARRGQRLTFAFTQDGTGGRTVTWNAVFKAAANGAGTAGQVGATSFVYDGAFWVQEAGALTFK